MRHLFWAGLFTVVMSGTARGDEYPFTGYVGTDRAEVASGPGRRFYTTDRLARGTEVEVFREDEAGWLAIRPPEGSFSWIPADEVEFTAEEDVGKVRQATQCWIGTKIERVQEHRSLVSLKPGELVQVLDRRSITDEAGAEQTWLKIAPPAGEFRYIHGRDISREPIAEPEPEPVVEKVIEKAEAEEPQTLTPALSQGEREQEEQQAEEPQRFKAAGKAIALQDIDAARGKLQELRGELAEINRAAEERAVEQCSSARRSARPRASPSRPTALFPASGVPASSCSPCRSPAAT